MTNVFPLNFSRPDEIQNINTRAAFVPITQAPQFILIMYTYTIN
jgi:hypothetical protein